MLRVGISGFIVIELFPCQFILFSLERSVELFPVFLSRLLFRLKISAELRIGVCGFLVIVLFALELRIEPFLCPFFGLAARTGELVLSF